MDRRWQLAWPITAAARQRKAVSGMKVCGRKQRQTIVSNICSTPADEALVPPPPPQCEPSAVQLNPALLVNPPSFCQHWRFRGQQQLGGLNSSLCRLLSASLHHAPSCPSCALGHLRASPRIAIFQPTQADMETAVQAHRTANLEIRHPAPPFFAGVFAGVVGMGHRTLHDVASSIVNGEGGMEVQDVMWRGATVVAGCHLKNHQSALSGPALPTISTS